MAILKHWNMLGEALVVLVRDPLAMLFAKVNSGAQVHVRTYTPFFRILEMAGQFVLEFGCV